MTPGGARPLAAGNGSVYLPNGQRVGATPNPCESSPSLFFILISPLTLTPPLLSLQTSQQV